MRILIIMIFSIAFFASCNSGNEKSTQSNTSPSLSSLHFEVKEVLQTSSYSYLFVEENNNEYWMAVSRLEVNVGDDFYYETGLEMLDFKSKELDRTFDRILFVDKISTVPILPKQNKLSGKTTTIEPKHNHDTKNVTIKPIEGGITIAELYKNRDQFDGKRILIKGQVVKVNSKIMGKNWVHLQDGTKDGDNYDLTITTQEELKVDDVVTFEGLVTLNKDFGHGYSYELIVEEAILVINKI